MLRVSETREDRERLFALMAVVEAPDRAASLPENDPGVIAIARRHRLSPLLSALAGQWLPARLAHAFAADRAGTAARNLALAYTAEECLRALTAANIPAMVLKGLSYERIIYKTPGVRATGDIDLLVRIEHRRRAFSVLDALGFEPRASSPGFDEPDYHEVALTRRDAEVDLHVALVPFVRGRIDYDAVWSAADPLDIGEAQALMLSPAHAVLFQALHMAVDHFDGPAIYAVDLARLLTRVGGFPAVDDEARRWRCRRALTTAVALAAALLPGWAREQILPSPDPVATLVARRYGPRAPIRRAEQLARKLAHFDGPLDALRYVAVQSRRRLRECIETVVFKRSPRERLGMSQVEKRQ